MSTPFRTWLAGLTSKSAPVDADELYVHDTVAGVSKRLTWSNLKATLKTYFDTVYATSTTERRHEWATPHDYAATATAGTADSASGWTVTRITVAANGTTTTGTASGAWDDRATLTYT